MRVKPTGAVALSIASAVILGISARPSAADGFSSFTTSGFAPPAWQWNGAYIGGHFGWAWTDAALHDVDLYNNPCTSCDFSYDSNGPFGGLQVGYNLQSGSIVYGLEGEIGYLGVSDDRQYPPYDGVRLPTDSLASLQGGVYGTIAGRLGFATNGFLIYGNAGWGFANVDAKFIDTDPTGTTLVSGTKASETLDGAVYGGGVEFYIGRNASVKIEYLRFDFGDTISHVATRSGGGSFQFDHEIDSYDTIKVGFNFKLDRPPPPPVEPLK